MVQSEKDGKSSRESDRRKTLFGGVLFDENSNKWDCKVSNISETGAMVRSKAVLKEGSFIDLKIIKLNDFRRAKVMWVKDGKFGVQFEVKMKKTDPGMAEFFNLMRKPRAY